MRVSDAQRWASEIRTFRVYPGTVSALTTLPPKWFHVRRMYLGIHEAYSALSPIGHLGVPSQWN